MSQVSTLQSLDLILEDVSAEINLSINALEQFSKKPEKTDALKKSLEHLNKLKGVFTLLEMLGAQRLVADAMAVIKSLGNKSPETRTKLLSITTMALARLMRYTEHVNHKPYDLPQLLLPAINGMRSAINAPMLSESAFFKCDSVKPRPDKELILITSDENAKKSRHFRQMYQFGLIEVLRQTNLTGGLKIMQRAMHNLDIACPRPQSPNLWWIAEAMFDGFIEDNLRLTKTRLKLFSRLDLAIRQVENKQGVDLAAEKREARLLAKELLYLTMISGSTTNRTTTVLKHFGLKPSEMSDNLIHLETQEMRGPSDQDYSSIAEALLDEIEVIRQALATSNENQSEPLDLEQTLKQMNNLSSLLKILQVSDQAVRLSVAIDLVETSISERKPISAKDANILVIIMDSVTQAVDESELPKYSGKAHNRREVLDPAKGKICEKTLKEVRQLMQDFLVFTGQKRKPLLLKTVSEHLAQIKLGFQQLKSEQAVSIVDASITFINYHLIKNPHTTSESAINLFADVISSLEFYLETLQFTAKPGAKILQFAEDCILELNRETRRGKTKANS